VTGTTTNAPKREFELTEWLASPVHRASCSRRLALQRETVLVVDPSAEIDRTLTRRHRVEHAITSVARHVTGLTWKVSAL
jgi:hypothetical protein